MKGRFIIYSRDASNKGLTLPEQVCSCLKKPWGAGWEPGSWILLPLKAVVFFFLSPLANIFLYVQMKLTFQLPFWILLHSTLALSQLGKYPQSPFPSV